MRTVFLLLAVAVLAPACSPSPARIGIYDSRAIAIAYAPSKWNSEFLKELEARLEEAQANKDEVMIRAVGERAKRRQAEFHQMAFGTASVKELLEPVKAEAAAVAKDAGVDLLVSRFEIHWSDPNVRFVDLTMKLVALYGPNETTLGHIRNLKEPASR